MVVFGVASLVEDPNEKVEALKAFTEHIIPGRWSDTRQPTRQEIVGTLVLSLPLTEASAKIRTGSPSDDEADYTLPFWAGELPLRMIAAEPVADPRLANGVDLPVYIKQYSRVLRE